MYLGRLPVSKSVVPKNALPKAAWIYDSASRSITGAAVLTKCEQIGARQELSWVVERAVSLASLFVVEPVTRKYDGSVFHLCLANELHLRTVACVFGGGIGLHFPEFID